MIAAIKFGESDMINKAGDIASLLGAAKFAAERHTGQRRKGTDKAPYVNHVIEVAETLCRVGGVTDADVLVAALLHDTVEGHAKRSLIS